MGNVTGAWISTDYVVEQMTKHISNQKVKIAARKEECIAHHMARKTFWLRRPFTREQAEVAYEEERRWTWELNVVPYTWNDLLETAKNCQRLGVYTMFLSAGDVRLVG